MTEAGQLHEMRRRMKLEIKRCQRWYSLVSRGRKLPGDPAPAWSIPLEVISTLTQILNSTNEDKRYH